MGKTAVIYAGRRQVYIRDMRRTIDTFQAVVEINNDRSIVNCNVSPLSNNYELKGREMAEHFESRGIDGFVFRNSYKYNPKTERGVRIEVVDGEKTNIRGVPRDKLRSFKRGLLKQLIGI